MVHAERQSWLWLGHQALGSGRNRQGGPPKGDGVARPQRHARLLHWCGRLGSKR